MIECIKTLLTYIPIIKKYRQFGKRYNERYAVSFIKFIMFQVIPVKYLGFFFEKTQYMPIDKYSSILRGNVFVGKCTRVQRSGCYIQGRGKVFIGDYVGIASNVAIISGNHDLYNQDLVTRKETIIGDHCWIATNSNIMAGVVLGPRTIVGAGSVVTKSFPEGHCVIAGNPAKLIKILKKEEMNYPKDDVEFYGYLDKDRFKSYYDCYYNSFDYGYVLFR